MADFGENKNNKNVPWWQPGMMLFVQLSGWIAVPIIAAVFLGNWLDQKYNTRPWLFLLTVLLAFVISMAGIVKEASKSIKQMEKFNKDKKDERK